MVDQHVDNSDPLVKWSISICINIDRCPRVASAACYVNKISRKARQRGVLIPGWLILFIIAEEFAGRKRGSNLVLFVYILVIVLSLLGIRFMDKTVIKTVAWIRLSVSIMHSIIYFYTILNEKIRSLIG